MVNSLENSAILPRKKVGRRSKQIGERMERITLSLPPGDIARLEAEAEEAGSVSAIVRLAVAEHFRRADKKRERQYEPAA